MERKNIFQGLNKVVVKIGTSVLTSSNNRLDLSVIEHLVEQVCILIKEKGVKVAMVSSGAIGAGMQLLGWEKRPAEISQLQAAASIGQSRLRGYMNGFRDEGINEKDFTTRDVYNAARENNARKTMQTLFELKVDRLSMKMTVLL